MFKALSLFRLTAPFPLPADSELAALAFKPCAPTQAASIGFVPPRGIGHAALIESIQGNHIIALQLEQRLLPAAVVKRRVEELAAVIEKETGRKPGAKRRKELKDQATLELLPQAFTRQKSIRVWVAPDIGLLAVDTTSASAVDLALTALSLAVPGMSLQPWNTKEAPAACMAAWLLDSMAPHGFALGRDCAMQSPDMTCATARFAHHALDVEAVTMHLAAGKQVRELALNHRDQVLFVLTDGFQLKRIELTIPEDDSGEADTDAFDGDVVLTAGALTPLITELTHAMGGLMDLLPTEKAWV